jgi:hypothetical protein
MASAEPASTEHEQQHVLLSCGCDFNLPPTDHLRTAFQASISGGGGSDRPPGHRPARYHQ